MTTPASLFVEHRAAIYRYLCRQVGRPEVAQELTQDVFLRATRAATPDTTAEGRRAWLYRIARNLALNHARDNNRRIQTQSLPEGLDAQTSATQELSVALADALATLNDLDRDVFLLRETGGLSYDEIGATLDMTTTAVRSRLHRARLALRTQLDRHL